MGLSLCPRAQQDFIRQSQRLWSWFPKRGTVHIKQALISILSKPNLVLFSFSFSFVQLQLQLCLASALFSFSFSLTLFGFSFVQLRLKFCSASASDSLGVDLVKSLLGW